MRSPSSILYSVAVALCLVTGVQSGRAGTSELTKTVEDTTYRVEWSGRTVSLSNITINGKPARRISINPETESIRVEFDYFYTYPKSGPIIQIMMGIGTREETLQLVSQSIPGPRGSKGHFKGEFSIPREVRAAAQSRGKTGFGLLVYFTACYDEKQARQFIQNGFIQHCSQAIRIDY